jgi:hypothetical protein
MVRWQTSNGLNGNSNFTPMEHMQHSLMVSLAPKQACKCHSRLCNAPASMQMHATYRYRSHTKTTLRQFEQVWRVASRPVKKGNKNISIDHNAASPDKFASRSLYLQM